MPERPFDTMAVVGAGFMGAQIGLHHAAHGYTVRIADVSQEALEGASEAHARELERRESKGQMSADEREAVVARITFTTDLEESMAGVGLVMEAASERLEVKRDLFARLDKASPPATILATTSSSIRISQVEDATDRPDRVLNMHYYPPVWRAPMVELMGGSATSEETMRTATAFARASGLTPLLVTKESTGFIFNRVWRAIKRECLEVVDAGVATHEDVDRAWMITFSSPGPFGMMDLVGLDVVRDIELVYYREEGRTEADLPRVLVEKVERGELGRKTGKGFYSYPDPAYRQPGFVQGS